MPLFFIKHYFNTIQHRISALNRTPRGGIIAAYSLSGEYQQKNLVVEDNEDCRELQACVIRRLGYVVIEADNGAAAIDEALAGHPDLILMDLNMPKMNGEEATEQLKNQPSTEIYQLLSVRLTVPVQE